METRLSKPLTVLFLFLLAVGAGCDTAEESDDGPRVLTGTWTGPLTHPNPSFSGTLTLQVTQTGNTLSGTATWIYPGEQLTGTLSGGAPDEGPVAYTLDFGSRGVYFHDVNGGNSALSGTWESSRGIRGAVSLERQ